MSEKKAAENLQSYGLSMIWQSLLNPSPFIVSPSLGYQMCLAQFGIRHTQINTLPQGAVVETPRWVSKKNILSFI